MVDENGTINGEEMGEESEQSEERGARELDFILDIPLELSVELGKTKMLVNDLLQLAQGSIIELNKLAGEPLEVYINRKLIARGEVVVVNEKFGVRLTDVITPIDRVKSLAAEDQ
nr:flagellar motor switch protein FliN [uncultured Desulfobacter sp.]